MDPTLLEEESRYDSGELKAIRKDLTEHIEAHNRFVLNFGHHEENEREWRDKQAKMIDSLMIVSNNNAVVIRELTKELERHVNATQGILNIYRDAQGVARFMKWAAGAVVAVTGLIVWLKDKVNITF